MLLSSPVFIFRIEPPKTQKLHYEDSFSSMEKESADELGKVSSERDNVVLALENSSAESVIKAIERYIPSLFGLIIAIEPLPKEATKSLRVSWTTPIGLKYNSSAYSNGSLRYEWIMLLLTLGVTYRNAAFELHQTTSESNFEENSKVVADYLKKSASLFDMVKEQWTEFYPKPDTSFPEVLEQTYVALSLMSLAEAQQLAIRKAVKGTSGGTIAKLCADIALKLEQADSIFKPMFTSNQIAITALAGYLSLSGCLFRALALKYMGIEVEKAGQYGLSVGYLAAAVAAIPEEKMKVKNMVALEGFIKEVKRERDEIVQMHKKFASDNDTIYLDKVPDINSIPFPEAKSLMKPVVVAFPPPRTFTLTVKQGYQCILQ